jgi:hypothetical protein
VAGDADAALQIIDSLPFDRVPAHVTELVTRMRVVLLSRTGRVAEALAAAGSLTDSRDPHVRMMPSYLRWQAGDPSEFAIHPARLHSSGSINDRDRVAGAAEAAAISSSLGDRALAHAARDQIAAYLEDCNEPRDSAVGSGAIACTHVLDHDEPAARSSIAAHLARFPIGNRPGMLHLRRHIAVAYALIEPLREHWDGVDLGPAHEVAREVARRFLDARHGELGPSATIPDAGQVVTWLPLPWSVELAVAACRLGAPAGYDWRLRWPDGRTPRCGPSWNGWQPATVATSHRPPPRCSPTFPSSPGHPCGSTSSARCGWRWVDSWSIVRSCGEHVSERCLRC